MKAWRLLLLGYLLTAPLPALVVEAAHIRLYYEQIEWWLVGVYSAPVVALAARLGLGSLGTASLIYWLGLLLVWLVWRLAVALRPIGRT